MKVGAKVRQWLKADTSEELPLAARPPLGAPDPPAGAGPAPRRRAVCCSGGGIRAAAFALGGVQGLQRRTGGSRSWYDGVDLVSAVSGGSYLAGSLAMVNHERPEGSPPPYAVGSPEDNRLRNHTRYLAEDSRVAAVGVLSILYGLLLNLLPILAGIYVAAKLVGWLLYRTGVLTTTADSQWRVHHAAAVAAIAGCVAGAGLLAFAVDRVHDVYWTPRPSLTTALRAWALRLFSAAAVIALLGVGLPALLRLLNTVQIDVLGAAVPKQIGTFVGTVLGLVALVRATVGRFKGKLQTSTEGRPSRVAGWLGRALRAVTPWLGSALAVALLLVAFVAWAAAGAYGGLQAQELIGIAAAVAVTLAWQAVTDINRNSVHPFYKERLSSAYAVRRTATGAEEIPYDKPIPLSGLTGDVPELIVCAAVNTTQPGVVPSGRGCAPFSFSPHHIGISSELTWSTAEYEDLAGHRLMTLPAAIAVSGAAVSPVMGRMTRAPLRLLLGLANVRLGLWLPNPRHADPRRAAPKVGASRREWLRWQWRQPGIHYLFKEIAGSLGLSGRWIYVTDGGHYENLGLVEALRRGVGEIVAFDASGDPPDSWVTFGEAVQTARADLGVEIDLDPSSMRPATGSDRAATLVVEGTCTYPSGRTARLWYCKLALPEKAQSSWDVYAWKSGHRDFPHDPTSQQLYGDREFEAYRRLGELAAHTALDMIGNYWPCGADDLPPTTGTPPASGNGSARAFAGRS